MAAIDLTAVDVLPWPYEFTSATTWQEVRIPTWCDLQITSDTDLWIAYKAAQDPASETNPADGGAVGTGKMPIYANSVVDADFPAQHGPQRGRVGNAQGEADGYLTVFLAAQSGTPTVYLEVRQAAQDQG